MLWVSEEQNVFTYSCNCTGLMLFHWDDLFMAFQMYLVLIFLFNVVCIMNLVHHVSLCLQAF